MARFGFASNSGSVTQNRHSLVGSTGSIVPGVLSVVLRTLLEEGVPALLGLLGAVRQAGGFSREELLTDPKELQKMWILRKLLHPMDEAQAIEFMLDKLKSTKTNVEFFNFMKR